MESHKKSYWITTQKPKVLQAISDVKIKDDYTIESILKLEQRINTCRESFKRGKGLATIYESDAYFVASMIAQELIDTYVNFAKYNNDWLNYCKAMGYRKNVDLDKLITRKQK